MSGPGKTLSFTIILALFFFVLFEWAYRCTGKQPGVYGNEFQPVDTVIEQSFLYSDSIGIVRFDRNSPYLPGGYAINADGFRSTFDYQPNILDSIREIRDGKLILLIGDSFTAGCCADPIDRSFSDLLSDNTHHIVLNFGIPGADPMQYKKILEVYLPKLKPDLAIIGFCSENDILLKERELTPNIPFWYDIKDCGWLPNKAIFEYPEGEQYLFSTAKEAYRYFESWYTLKGSNATWLEKLIRHSAVLTNIYIGLKRGKYFEIEPQTINSGISRTKAILTESRNTCQSSGTDFLLAYIPNLQDIKDGYPPDYIPSFVSGFHAIVPEKGIFSPADFFDQTGNSHFNNSGHYKFYQLLQLAIDR